MILRSFMSPVYEKPVIEVVIASEKSLFFELNFENGTVAEVMLKIYHEEGIPPNF